jgi:hypothetical protein
MELKNVYRGNEIRFANLFRSVAPVLLNEFVQVYPNFKNKDSINSIPAHQNPKGDAAVYSNPGAWRTVGIKSATAGFVESNRSMYPTAFELSESFGHECLLAGYSILEPNSVIYRHTDREHRDAKFIRIHIPLYVPNGDVGAEVQGEVMKWDDVWGFNNQKLHGAWNYTSEHRVVFLIDLSRKFCNLPPAPEWFPGCNDGIPEFKKTQSPV